MLIKHMQHENKHSKQWYAIKKVIMEMNGYILLVSRTHLMENIP